MRVYLADFLHMGGYHDKEAFWESNEDVSVAEPVISDDIAVLRLEGQFNGVVGVIKIEQIKRLSAYDHRYRVFTWTSLILKKKKREIPLQNALNRLDIDLWEKNVTGKMQSDCVTFTVTLKAIKARKFDFFSGKEQQ